MNAWVKKVLALAKIAQMHTNAAHDGFSDVIVGKWQYIMRTIEDAGGLLHPIESIYEKLIPALILVETTVYPKLENYFPYQHVNAVVKTLSFIFQLENSERERNDFIDKDYRNLSNVKCAIIHAIFPADDIFVHGLCVRLF